MIKYGVKLMLWEADPNTHGFYPIYIRVTINRDRKYISTGIFIPQRQWDDRAEQVRSGHPLAAQYNPDLAARKQKVVQYIIERQVAGEVLTASQVKAQFASGKNLHNIFDFIEQFIDDCRGKKRESTLENYRKHALRLRQFHGSKNLSFEEITPDFLRRYESHLRNPKDKGVKPVDGNYVYALWRTLKTFFNAAKKRKIITCYPFDEYENPVYENPTKEYLTLRELAAWEKFADTTTDPIERQTAIWFLLGCYTGLRISDWFAFDIDKHIQDERIRIRAKKNGEWVTMPVSAPLYRNLTRMRACPLTTVEPVINWTLKAIAKSLNIKKRITTHTGRHTFAVTICADRGVSSETTAELMGITITTCVVNYYRVTKRKIDRETMEAWKGL